MANYSAESLTRLRGYVAEFENAFASWMETQTETDHLTAVGLWPTVSRREGQDDAVVKRLELAVAETAGAAARAGSTPRAS